MDTHHNYGAILITGASSGIGRTTALHLDRLGFTVFGTVRSQKDAEALCTKGSNRLVPIIMDVTDQDSINRAREQVSQAVGEAGLAGLVNNAAVGFIAPLELIPLDELRWMFEVNVFGLMAVIQAFLPLLRQGHGRIVNISSIASLFVAPFHGPYSASKMSVEGLSNALRLELQPYDVQVSVVVCGSIKTPMWEKGKLLSERALKDVSPQALDLYAEHLQKMSAYFFKLGENGSQPEAAARTIAHALTARRTHNTYYVGPDANFYKIADKLIHGRLRDWIILHTTG